MSELCEECGVSRKTGYKWYHRYLEGGAAALHDQSRSPQNPSRKYSEEVMAEALELKLKHLAYGPKKIRAMLKRRFPDREWPSATRLYEVFKEHHLVCPRKLRRRVPRTHPLGELNESNDVWCADFKGRILTGDGSTYEPLTITDGFSRFAIRCAHLERKTFEEVWRVYTDAFEEYGLPHRIRTDNGPPFASTSAGRLSRLAINLVKVGIKPEWIKPGHPEESGRHERFHRSLKAETASPPAFTFAAQAQRTEVFVEEYNFERPHEALDLEVPGSVYVPSTRIWDGILRSPEYDTSRMEVRKVCRNGCIHWKRMNCYVGQVLTGEYIGLQPVGDGKLQAYYGPVWLGTVFEGEGFEVPILKRR